MKKKPKGQRDRYRNLIARGDVLYHERLIGGRRVRISTKTADWDTAASFRDLYEARKGLTRPGVAIEQAPTFADFAERYLKEDTADLAATTRHDRGLYLRETGPVVRFLGRHRLDDVTPALLRQW